MSEACTLAPCLGAQCLESAWHADAFVFGKTGTPWSTSWVGGTPEVLLLGFCTAWISDFFMLLCARGGVGGEPVYKNCACIFCVHVQASAEGHNVGRIKEKI